MMQKLRIFAAVVMIMSLMCGISATAADLYSTISNVGYIEEAGTDAYRSERCKLDLYLPQGKKDFPTVVFFHGGGLEGGEKFIPELLKGQGFAVVAPNYRLSPRAQHPAYIDDAAAAVAWTMRHIAEYGGTSSKVWVCGHSAGGYLTLMLALDKAYLGAYGIDADSIAGYVPFSGQTNTHYTIRKERGLDTQIPIIDEYAPLFHARKLGTRMLLISGDRDKEMLARYTENLHMQEILNAKGNKVEFYELKGFDHGTMLEPACLLLRQMIHRSEKKK